jgi:hypothetical protein
MDIIVDKPQLVRVVLLYLNNNFGDLTPKKHKNYPNFLFYVNPHNEVIMEYDKKIGEVYIPYNSIWSKIKSLFYINDDDAKSIIKVWLEKDYKLSEVIPRTGAQFYFKQWLEED